MKNYLLLSFILLAGWQIAAQEAAPPEGHHSMKGSHRLTLGLGHTHTSKGEVEGETQWLVLPSFSLSYDYWLSDRWASKIFPKKQPSHKTHN